MRSTKKNDCISKFYGSFTSTTYYQLRVAFESNLRTPSLWLIFRMNLSTLIHLLFTTSVWSGEVDSDGRLAFNFFNKKNFIYIGVYAMGCVLFIWRYTIPLLQENHDYSLHNVYELIWVHYIIMNQTMVIFNKLIMKKMNGYIMNKISADLTITSQVIFTVIGLTMSGIFIIWLMLRSLPLDIFLWVSVLLLIPTWAISVVNVWLSPMACVALLKADIVHMMQGIVTVKSINQLKEQIDLVANVLVYFIVPILAICQIFIIFSFFISIYDINKFMYMLTALFMSIFSYKVLADLEDCYDKIEEVVQKAKRDACGAATIKEMMTLMIEADSLKETHPFSASRFFTFELSTMTAMLATTLTYLVVLLQSF